MSEPIRRKVVIVNKLGLHARAASKLVNSASGFDSTITLYREDRQADAKSIMGVMMLAASRGVELDIEANGTDAALAVDALEKLIADKFGESE